MRGFYWICVDHPTNRAVIHEADCGFCNDGRGMKDDKDPESIEWLGPFSDADDAETHARATGKDTVRWCGHCARRAGT